MSTGHKQLQDCSFHPSEQLVAAGIITGQVRVSEYDGTSTTRRSQKRLHSESCRAVQFSSSGDCLLTGSADKSLVVLDTGTCKVQKTYQDAHPAGVSRLLALSESTFASGMVPHLLFASSVTFARNGMHLAVICSTGICSLQTDSSVSLHASGDDDGLIKTWDQRQVEPSGSFDAHTDFVSDMVLHDREQCLVAVSGDGTLTVNDLRTGKVRPCLQAIALGHIA